MVILLEVRRWYTRCMASIPKLSKTERAAARLKKKKSGPSAMKRIAARAALQTKKADEPAS
jgi:hypothetical protein